MVIVPDYYNEFRCLAGACRRSCCIGWEIDIDPQALRRFEGLPGALGQKLRQSIDRQSEPPHFILDDRERCPFLQADGLCELILTLGEDSLCQICRDHPRFRNDFAGRTEMGLGLCCEAAARLVLGRKEPVCFPGLPEREPGPAGLRNRALALAQDRRLSVGERAERLLALFGQRLPEKSMTEWADIFLSLERLDGAWTERLLLLRSGEEGDAAGFRRHMQDRQTEYEQFLVYLLWRHLAAAPDEEEMGLRAAFAALGCQLLYAIGERLWKRCGRFDFEDQAELARLFSSEIEYSDENVERLLDVLAGFE